MKTLIFTNTNYSIAYVLYCVLKNQPRVYNFVFDIEYEILTQDPYFSDRIWSLNDNFVFRETIENKDSIILDFDLDYTISRHSDYFNYIVDKLNIDDRFEYARLIPFEEEKEKINRLITESNQNNFSNVLFAPINLDWADSSFNEQQQAVISKELADAVNLIMVQPSDDLSSLSELFYLTEQCDFVISNLDVFHYFAVATNTPSFLNLNAYEVTSVPKNCYVWDPERNNKFPVISKYFTTEYKKYKGSNYRLLQYNPNELLSEILKSLNASNIPYRCNTNQ
jgi:hypothetical protein